MGDGTAVFSSRTSVFRGGKITISDGRGGKDNRLSGYSKKHADDNGDNNKRINAKRRRRPLRLLSSAATSLKFGIPGGYVLCWTSQCRKNWFLPLTRFS